MNEVSENEKSEVETVCYSSSLIPSFAGLLVPQPLISLAVLPFSALAVLAIAAQFLFATIDAAVLRQSTAGMGKSRAWELIVFTSGPSLIASVQTLLVLPSAWCRI